MNTPIVVRILPQKQQKCKCERDSNEPCHVGYGSQQNQIILGVVDHRSITGNLIIYQILPEDTTEGPWYCCDDCVVFS